MLQLCKGYESVTKFAGEEFLVGFVLAAEWTLGDAAAELTIIAQDCRQEWQTLLDAAYDQLAESLDSVRLDDEKEEYPSIVFREKMLEACRNLTDDEGFDLFYDVENGRSPSGDYCWTRFHLTQDMLRGFAWGLDFLKTTDRTDNLFLFSDGKLVDNPKKYLTDMSV